MKDEYIKLIAEQDEILATHREFWMNAKTSDDRSKHMRRINKALDDRLRLMAKRDAS